MDHHNNSHPSLQLSRFYREISPRLERVYVLPDIEAFSNHNNYLKLLYGDLLTHPGVEVHSRSFLSPLILWRRWLGEQSIVHHHWFECRDLRSFFNLLWKISLLMIYRLSGGVVVWTAHNLHPHHGRMPRANRWLRRIWARIPNFIHVHCQSAAEMTAETYRLPPEKFVVIPHPPYPVYPCHEENPRSYIARKYLGQAPLTDRPLFLMPGYIAEYKGLLEVARLCADLPARPQLLIAGAVKTGSEEYAGRLLALAEQQAHIHVIPRHIPEAELPLFFAAADYVLFNYRAILQSGAVVLARCYQKPVIVPAIGCLQELSGPDVWHFSDTEQLRKILQTLSASPG